MNDIFLLCLSAVTFSGKCRVKRAILSVSPTNVKGKESFLSGNLYTNFPSTILISRFKNDARVP